MAEQILLQGKTIGTEEFLLAGPPEGRSARSAGEDLLAGRSQWITLLCEVLPRALFTPAVIGLLVAFPLLVFAEGALGAVEFFSTIGNVLSYARVMAIGAASVMLAAVANRMAGALGSVLVGVAFALLFHLVNFALGLFSPTVQALRLQYVEFFQHFYSPGGQPYRPFAATGDQ